jgi:hypothetical protein
VFGHDTHAYYGESPISSGTGDISVRRLRSDPDSPDWSE